MRNKFKGGRGGWGDKTLIAVFIVFSSPLIKNFLFHKLDFGFISPPSGLQHHCFYVKPKQSTVRALQLAICALCFSQPKCLLSIKVEVMNVTITVEEQVAAVITDNCQLCREILWEHFGVVSPSLCDRVPGALGLFYSPWCLSSLHSWEDFQGSALWDQMEFKIVSLKMKHLVSEWVRSKKNPQRNS